MAAGGASGWRVRNMLCDVGRDVSAPDASLPSCLPARLLPCRAGACRPQPATAAADASTTARRRAYKQMRTFPPLAQHGTTPSCAVHTRWLPCLSHTRSPLERGTHFGTRRVNPTRRGSPVSACLLCRPASSPPPLCSFATTPSCFPTTTRSSSSGSSGGEAALPVPPMLRHDDHPGCPDDHTLQRGNWQRQTGVAYGAAARCG